MCGLAGFAGSGEGIYIDPDRRVFFGHRRLAILDIEDGAQPMWNEDGQVGVVFNGEIYNHEELRDSLEKAGHVFRSNHSDTEVLVHGYEEWGSALPERLNGMFAFAVYDRRAGRLFLARDRFGEKPLYYSLSPHVFAFASELTALLCHHRVDESLSTRSLQKFFAYGYLSAPNAIFSGSHNELFAGYDPFEALGIARRYARLVPTGIHKGIRRLADLLPVSSSNMSLDFKLRRGLMGMSYPEYVRIPIWMAPVEPDIMDEVFDSPLSLEDLYDEAIQLGNSGESTHPVDRSLDFFSNLYLPDNILTKVDRASMILSLESRAVFLDNDLVEFCRRLPNHYKYRNGTRKYLFKKALQGHLPQDIIERRKKGFGIPLARWLRSVPEVMPSRGVAGMKLPYLTKTSHDALGEMILEVTKVEENAQIPPDAFTKPGD